MNENAAQLIRDLAEKLGTTTEYLWSVLIRQAPISASVELAVYPVLVAAGVWGLRRANMADMERDAKAILRMLIGLYFLFLLTFASCRLPVIVAGYVNPEYWAIDFILKMIK